MQAHTKRFSLVQKLQAKTEHGKYILLHFVRLKIQPQVAFQSLFTEHVCLMLNQV